MQGKIMIELNDQEATKLVDILKQEIQTDLIVKLTEKLERSLMFHKAAVEGFGS